MLQRTHNNRLPLIVACLAKNYRRSIEPKPRKLAGAINTSDLQWRAVRLDYRHGHTHCSEIACGSAYTVYVNTGVAPQTVPQLLLALCVPARCVCSHPII
jgi:hypothetical protein